MKNRKKKQLLTLLHTVHPLCYSGSKAQTPPGCLLAACQITHRVVAGSVDNVNLLEVPVQEVSAYGQDVTAAAVVLLHGH